MRSVSLLKSRSDFSERAESITGHGRLAGMVEDFFRLTRRRFSENDVRICAAESE